MARLSLPQTLSVLVGLVSVTTASELATLTPCPACPSSAAPPPITITEQYQHVSTCLPSTTRVYSTYSINSTLSFNNTLKTVPTSTVNATVKTVPTCSDYSWVSTVIPTVTNTAFGNVTVTTTDQSVLFRTYHSTVTATTTHTLRVPYAPHGNASYHFQNATWLNRTIEKSTTTIDIKDIARYDNLGPIAIPGYDGSGLCTDCGPDSHGAITQRLEVQSCANHNCTTFNETWIARPITSHSGGGASPATVTGSPAYVTSTYCASPTPGSIIHKLPSPTKAEPNPSCTVFTIKAFRDNSAYSHGTLGYLVFAHHDAMLSPDQQRAEALTLLPDGQVQARGLSVWPLRSGSAILSTHDSSEEAYGSWKITSDGTLHHYGSGNTLFCVSKDNVIFALGSKGVPSSCKPVKLIPQCGSAPPPPDSQPLPPSHSQIQPPIYSQHSEYHSAKTTAPIPYSAPVYHPSAKTSHRISTPQNSDEPEPYPTEHPYPSGYPNPYPTDEPYPTGGPYPTGEPYPTDEPYPTAYPSGDMEDEPEPYPTAYPDEPDEPDEPPYYGTTGNHGHKTSSAPAYPIPTYKASSHAGESQTIFPPAYTVPPSYPSSKSSSPSQHTTKDIPGVYANASTRLDTTTSSTQDPLPYGLSNNTAKSTLAHPSSATTLTDLPEYSRPSNSSTTMPHLPSYTTLVPAYGSIIIPQSYGHVSEDSIATSSTSGATSITVVLSSSPSTLTNSTFPTSSSSITSSTLDITVIPVGPQAITPSTSTSAQQYLPSSTTSGSEPTLQRTTSLTSILVSSASSSSVLPLAAVSASPDVSTPLVTIPTAVATPAASLASSSLPGPVSVQQIISSAESSSTPSPTSAQPQVAGSAAYSSPAAGSVLVEPKVTPSPATSAQLSASAPASSQIGDPAVSSPSDPTESPAATTTPIT